METQLPTDKDIKELVAFLPRLYAKGFNPLKNTDKKIYTEEELPYMTFHTEYNDVVEKFRALATKKCWCDYQYNPSKAYDMVEHDDFIRNATIDQIRTMLTFCMRGERFCSGHLGTMIEEGKIRRILERLKDIHKTLPNRVSL